ncbi:DUF779 domain-containing protein (plasmid) [Rhizobium sp. CCGE531]|nr:DUF779 domain-containing protein [Rhizobium sp. CCGE531]AYG74836.1 DUF779 domain-containing protein [Rhizobium sp. CCGE532]
MIGGVPVYISGSQFKAWKYTQITIDGVTGLGRQMPECSAQRCNLWKRRYVDLYPGLSKF